MATLDLDKISRNKNIVVHANDKQIEEIKKCIKVVKEEKLDNDIYKLVVVTKTVKTSVILVRLTMGDLGGDTTRKEEVADFENSDTFYKGARAKKGYKLIVDEYSNDRNARLFRGFAAIESQWRQIIATKLGLDNIKSTANPQNYKSSIPDHKISQYSLSEFFEWFLFSDASDDFIRKEWKKLDRPTVNSVLKLRKLNKLDEMGLSITQDELVFLQGVRNACMHFRVITVADYKKAVRIINEYLRSEGLKQFAESFSEIMKPFMKSFNELAKSMQSIQIPKINLYMPPDFFNKL